MTINELPFDAFYQLDYLLKKELDSTVVVYTDNNLQLCLADKGYLYFNSDDKQKDHITHYKIYRITEKLLNSTKDEILEDIVGLSINTILDKKVISILDIPSNISEMLVEWVEEPSEISELFTIDEPIFKYLFFHGFVYGQPLDPHFYPSDKLINYIAVGGSGSVLKVITGKHFVENLKIKQENKESKDIQLMKELAQTYGYSISRN